MTAVQGLMAKGSPALPKWLFFLKIAIIVLAFAILIAAAVNVAAFSDYWTGFGYAGDTGPGGFSIFNAIFTWIVIGSMLILDWKFPDFHFRIAYAVLLPILAIFWLSAWAWAASVASAVRVWNGSGDGTLSQYSGSIAAVAALGAFIWVAVIVLTVFYFLACLRNSSNTAATPNQTEIGNVPPKDYSHDHHQAAQDPYTGATTTTAPPQDPAYQQPASYPVQETAQYQQPQDQAQYPPQNTHQAPYPNQSQLP